MPRLRAERWTRSFAISAGCGWLGGSARIYLDRADQLPVGERSKKQPTLLLDLGGHGFERAARLLV